jgi:hypothetical protein
MEKEIKFEAFKIENLLYNFNSIYYLMNILGVFNE